MSGWIRCWIVGWVMGMMGVSAHGVERMALKDVRTFMIQTGKLESREAIERLATSDYDMLVIDTMSTVQALASVDMRPVVERLRAGKAGRIVLVYLDVAEAEAYRTYWQAGWRGPSFWRKSNPDFILCDDPEGWSGNYPVAYWDARWREIVTNATKHVMKEGFDGVYLDWVQGNSDPTVVAAAKKQGVDPNQTMVDLIAAVGGMARGVKKDALVVAQNGCYLIDSVPRFTGVIDGIGFEHTWFGGKADMSWGDAGAGDIANEEKGPYSTERRIEQYGKYLKAGVPVFTVDYCLKPQNAKRVYAEAGAHGFVGLVSQSSLEGVTGTPPPVLGAPPGK